MKRSAYIILTILLAGGLFLSESCKPRKAKGSSAPQVEGKGNFDDYFIDASTHFNNNNFELAQKLYEKCLSLNPDVPAVYYQLSRIEIRAKKTDKGLHYAQKANQLDPSNAYYACWLAQLYSKNGERKAGIDILESTYKLNLKNELLVNSLDTQYRLSGQTDKNIALWQSFIKNKGFSLKYASNLISLYKIKKDYASAHQMYDEIKKAAPRKVKYYIEDGNLYLEENNEEKAMQNYKRALDIQPENYNLNVSMFKYLLRKKDLVNARIHMMNAVSDAGTDFQIKAGFLSEIKIKMTEDSSLKSSSQEIASKLRQAYPANKLALLAAAEFSTITDDFQNAYHSYRKVTYIDPNLFDAWTGAFRSSKVFHSADTIKTLTENAREYFPFSYLIFKESASAANAIGDVQLSLTYVEDGLKYSSSNEDKIALLSIKSRNLLNSGKTDECKKVLNEALLLNSEDTGLLELMGDVLMKEGNKTEAMKYWNKARSLGNNSEALNNKIKS